MFHFLKKKKVVKYIPQHGIINLKKYSEYQKSLDLINITTEELGILKSAQPELIKYIDEIIDSFYENIGRENELTELIKHFSNVDRLKRTLKPHIIDLFNGTIDDKFIEVRIKVAKVHVKINLKIKWYMSSFQHIVNTILDYIDTKDYNFSTNIEYKRKLRLAVSKIINFEEQIVLSEYEKEIDFLRTQQEEERKEIFDSILEETDSLTTTIDSANSSYEELIAESTELITVATDLNEKAEDTLDKSEKGNGLVEKQYEIFDSLWSRIDQSMKKLEEVQGKIEFVDNILISINGVSDQTNMLSLNASIEAARAGSAGKTFSIVANEVRKLSNETKNLSKEIEESIQNLHSELFELTETFKLMQEEVSNSKDQMSETSKGFFNINKSVSDMTHKFDFLLSKTDKMEKTLTEVNYSMLLTKEATSRLKDIEKSYS